MLSLSEGNGLVCSLLCSWMLLAYLRFQREVTNAFVRDISFAKTVFQGKITFLPNLQIFMEIVVIVRKNEDLQGQQIFQVFRKCLFQSNEVLVTHSIR